MTTVVVMIVIKKEGQVIIKINESEVRYIVL